MCTAHVDIDANVFTRCTRGAFMSGADLDIECAVHTCEERMGSVAGEELGMSRVRCAALI